MGMGGPCFLNCGRRLMQIQVKPERSLPELFEQLDFEDMWDDAELVSPVRYCRASKSLRLPAEWRDVFPTWL